MRPRLYVIPASPPCACIEAALALKGVAYDVTVLPNFLHIPHQLVRFRVPTVPTMTLDGEKIAGSRTIAARLDARWPDPPLYAGGEPVRAAEAWGDETLQPVGRRLITWVLSHRRSAAPSYLEGAALPLPRRAVPVLAPLMAPLGAVRNRSSAAAVRADLRALPGLLERVDRWIGEGVLGGEAPNAADLQIGAVLRMLLTIDDLAPVIARYPAAAALARRHFPRYPGRVPAGVLPADWLPAGA